MKQSCDDDRATAEPASNVVPFHSTEIGVAGPTEDASAIPAGYVARADGVYALEGDAAGDVHHVRICSPIAVVGCCRRSSVTGWSRVVDIVDPDDRTHRLLLDEALFNGQPAALLNPLLDCGLRVAKGAAARKQVADLLGGWSPKVSFVRLPRVGWTDDDFDTFAFADGTMVVSRRWWKFEGGVISG